MTRREQILARLLEILGSAESFRTVARNLDEFPEEVRPMAILLDGDEEAAPEFQRSWVKGIVPIIVDMRPLVVVSFGGKPEEIGSDINELIGQVVYAVMSDSVLSGLVTTNGGVYYERTDYRLSHSLAIDCDMQMQFRIRYPLLPSSP